MAEMAETRHPYAGRTAILATMRRKEEAIAPALLSTLGLIVKSSSACLCETCGAPTQLISAERFECSSCDYAEERPRVDGTLRAPVQHCQLWNP